MTLYLTHTLHVFADQSSFLPSKNPSKKSQQTSSPLLLSQGSSAQATREMILVLACWHTFSWGCWPLLLPSWVSLPACTHQKTLHPPGSLHGYPCVHAMTAHLIVCQMLASLPVLPQAREKKHHQAIQNQARRCRILRYQHLLHCHPKASFVNQWWLLLLVFFFPLLVSL